MGRDSANCGDSGPSVATHPRRSPGFHPSQQQGTGSSTNACTPLHPTPPLSRTASARGVYMTGVFEPADQ